MLNILYLRVSKEEEEKQDIEIQKEKILKKFGLNESECIILEERISAYDIDKVIKRKKFLRLISLIFDAEDTTIKDIFLRDLKKREINLYVWDYHRIMRIMEFSVLFSILTDLFDIKIYSYKDSDTIFSKAVTPSEKLLKYIQIGIKAFSGEDYSYHTSQNIKKAVKIKNQITYGTKKDPQGRKWGRPFLDSSGNALSLSLDKIACINNRIIALSKYFRKQGKQFFYSDIIEKIKKEFNLKISKSYVSRILNKRKQP